MRIPEELNQAIENEIKNIKINELKEEALNLSNRYLNKERTGKTLLSRDIEALAYSIMRMPATYSATATVLKYTVDIIKKTKFNTLLDIGAGTGASTWAASYVLDIENVKCIEREPAMKKLGTALMKNNKNITNIEWLDKDILTAELPKVDIIIASYVINELKEEDRKEVIEKIFNLNSELVIIVEPGTPKGFENIKTVQKMALEKEKYIVAPCTSQEICKLPKDDWCHATVRVERTKTHKTLKNAELSYEDEKFSYIVVANEKYNLPEKRILRHPIIEKGKIILKICNKGSIETKIITKKDKEIYKSVKKKKCGDIK